MWTNSKCCAAADIFHDRVMKRWLSIGSLAAFLLVILAPFGVEAATGITAAAHPDGSPAAPIATAISTVTGIAISPLLGTGAYGAYTWWKAKNDTARKALPWFAQVAFWLPALLVV